MSDRVPPAAWPRGMGAEVAAAYVGISETMLREEVPCSARIGKRVIWLREDLDAYLDRVASRGRVKIDPVVEALAGGKGRAALR